MSDMSLMDNLNDLKNLLSNIDSNIRFRDIHWDTKRILLQDFWILLWEKKFI